VVLLQGRDRARRETAEPTKASSHEPQGKRERNCAGDLGMTPGQTCTWTPVPSAVPAHCPSKAPHVRPWHQSAFGLVEWTLHTETCANHAVCRPQLTDWGPVIGWSERASPIKFQGHLSIVRIERKVAEAGARCRRPIPVRLVAGRQRIVYHILSDSILCRALVQTIHLSR
jgi:hypothetical protein